MAKSWLARVGPDLSLAIRIATVYFFFAIISIELFRLGNGIAVIWFANAIGVAALSRLPFQRWACPLVMLALSIILANWLMGSSVASALFFLPGNLVEVTLGAYLVRQQRRDAGYFYNQFSMLKLIWLGVLLPVMAGAFVSAMLSSLDGRMPVLNVVMHWLEGSAIGGVSVLPAAYWVSVHGLAGLKRQLTQAYLPALLIVALAVATLVPLLLPFPFIYMSIPLFYIAYHSGVAGTVLANLLVAVNICILISLGYLLPPPTIYSWGYTLFYLPIMATLIPPLMLAIAMDMGRSAAQALHQSERRYRSLYQHTPAMLYSCDLEGRILTVNEVWLKAMGFSQNEVLGEMADKFMSHESAQQFVNQIIPQLLQYGACQNIRQQLINKQGSAVDVLMTAAQEMDEAGRTGRLLMVLLDISDKVRAQHLAYHDALTQLPNRLLFTDRLEQACQNNSRTEGKFAVVFLDLDHFKEINDSLGHEIGDLLLIEVAQRLEGAVRSSDTISRLGGDEFVMLLGGLCPGEEADQMAEKIRSVIASPYLLNGYPVHISASIGLAYFPRDGLDGHALMRAADEAMYCSKRAGRNCFMNSHC
ncbi:diguanylate cyclase [Chitinibacter fontanus]|uniref:Diguanylate cyclase n=1 Tax=Chitinibacter fontanus TaxID=1737446 RepID=A0A7D5V8M9_9NEIS|nr:sensor domain-containing diguanylate cyclase [Chitinibacter fontanus]QLI80836.1 diguanylate cyclase [Chitinibacter fontanus]